MNGEIKYGYIREDDFNYENIEYIFDDASRFINGYAYAVIKGNGFIINRDFEIVLRDNEFYHITNNVRDGVVEIQDRKSGKYGFLTISGKRLPIAFITEQVSFLMEYVLFLAKAL